MSRNIKINPLTILLVDDHDDTRESVRDWLKFQGHTVATASDVKSALRVGGKKTFDVLICDVQLPDGDGRTVLEKLNARRKFPAIAISGHCGPSDLARSKAAGFFTHLVKPFSPEELDALLATAHRELKRGDSAPAKKKKKSKIKTAR